ncbi:MAG: hypothetical protein IPL84_04565 [Chitinophagaceae bacterium]|nr:hypothetical protein [Chitinophagaceae bacterium]
MKKITGLFILIGMISSSIVVQAQSGWRFIADKRVAFGVDHDVIVTGNTNDDFRKLKLKVTDGPLKMYDMKVYFDNGSVQDVSIRFHIPEGGESRVIDLDGGLRHIRRIEFWYETKRFRKGRARVAVWGFK